VVDYTIEHFQQSTGLGLVLRSVQV